VQRPSFPGGASSLTALHCLRIWGLAGPQCFGRDVLLVHARTVEMQAAGYRLVSGGVRSNLSEWIVDSMHCLNRTGLGNKLKNSTGS